MAFAAAARTRVLGRVLIVRRGARRAARNERQVLGRRDCILVRYRHRRRGVAVLVLDCDCHRAVALRRSEIGHKFLGCRLRHIPGLRIVAPRDCDAYAFRRPLRGCRVEVRVHVAPDRPGDRIAAGKSARNLPGVRIGFRRLERTTWRHVLDIDALRSGRGVIVGCGRPACRERCRGRHLRVDRKSVHRGHHRTVHFADGEFYRRGARQTDLHRRRTRVVVVAVRARDDVVVRGIDLQKTGVDFKFRYGRLGRNRHLDFQRIVLLLVPVAETNGNLAAALGFIVGLRRRCDFHSRVVQNLDLHRVICRRPVVHVLVLHLGYDLPRAGLVERIFERFRRRVRISVDDLWIPDDNVIAARRPFRLELVVFRRFVGVRQVVGSFVLDNRLESARHAFRDAVGILVAAAFGCNAIHFKARDGRLDVEDAEPGFVGRIAAYLVFRGRPVPIGLRREHDLEGQTEPAFRFGETVQQLHRAGDRLLVGADGPAAAAADDIAGAILADDGIVAVSSFELRDILIRIARPQIGIQGAAGLVFRAQLDFELGDIAFLISILVGRHRNSTRRLDHRLERIKLAAELAADGRNDVNERILAVHRLWELQLRLVQRFRSVGSERIEIVALPHVIRAGELGERTARRPRILDPDLIAFRAVLHVGVRVLNRNLHVRRIAGHRIEGTVDRHHGRARHLDFRRVLAGEISIRRGIGHPRCECDAFRDGRRMRIGAQEVGVDGRRRRLPDRQFYLDRRGQGRHIRHLVLRRELHVLADVSRPDDRGRNRDLDIIRIGLRSLDPDRSLRDGEILVRRDVLGTRLHRQGRRQGFAHRDGDRQVVDCPATS